LLKTSIFTFILSIYLLVAIHSSVFASHTNHSILTSNADEKADRSAVFKNTENYQVTFEYVNDNFITRRYFEPILNEGKDDNVTASFWLQVALETDARWWMLNIHQTIITNKTQEYRTDLLSIYPSIEQRFENSQLVLGAGLIARGNFGGESIQSTYHRIADITPVKLVYAGNNTIGLLLLTGYEYRLHESERSILGCFLRNSLKGGPGPSSFRTGIKLDLISRRLLSNGLIQFQVNVGYSTTYGSDKYISPIFASGHYQGLLASIGYADKLLGTVWISLNQYGLHQTHFGITLTFGWNGDRLSDFGEVLYP